MSVALAIAALLLASPAPAIAVETCTDGRAVRATNAGLPDLQRSGNRVVEPCEPFDAVYVDHQLDRLPAWIVAHPGRPGDRWLLTYEDGRAFGFRDGRLSEVHSRLSGSEPPDASMLDGRVRVDARTASAEVGSIPHGRDASDGLLIASLVGPTDRYPHGVLGDDIEASAVQLRTDTVVGPRIELPEHEVVEGISAITADLGGDIDAILVTVSDAEDGARLRAYGVDGDVIAESDAIGTGFRWLHQIGVGPTGPSGETEIITVRTPHIGGVVEAYQREGDRLERVAALAGYSSHVIGSPNLDMALLADTDADGQAEVIVPDQSMTELAVLERTAAGFVEIERLPLDGRLASNVAAAVDDHGRLSLAVVTDDGRLRIFR